MAASSSAAGAAGATAAFTIPPLYAAADPRAQELMQALRVLDNEVLALQGCNLLNDELVHSVMSLPTDSGFLVLRALDRMKSLGVVGRSDAMAGVTAAVALLRTELLRLVQLRWALDCKALHSLVASISGDFTSAAYLGALGTGDLAVVSQWYEGAYQAYREWKQRQEMEDNPRMHIARSWRLRQLPEMFGEAIVLVVVVVVVIVVVRST